MEELTSRERVFRAIERKEPDRVPIGELTINEQLIDRIYPGMSYYDFIDEVGYDYVGPNITWDKLGKVKWLDEEKQIFLDRWGITRQLTTEILPVPIEPAIKTKQDLLNYTPPDPAEEPLLKILPELIERFKGKKATFILGRDAWTGPYMLRGMANLMVDLFDNPGMVEDIIRINVDYYKEVHRLAIELGIDVIHLVDDYAFKSGPLISPAHFKKYIYPGLVEIAEDVKKHGAYCLKHTDGNIWSIIDLLVDSPIDGLGPLEIGCDMDLARVKEKYGDKIAVMGNVSVDLLGRGTPEEIHTMAKDIIARVSPGGGHIFSSDNSITSGTQEANLFEMIKVCKEGGVYPIR